MDISYRYLARLHRYIPSETIWISFLLMAFAIIVPLALSKNMVLARRRVAIALLSEYLFLII